MKYPIDKTGMKEAPNYRLVRTCETCEFAYVDFDWHVECTRFKDDGGFREVCDDWQLRENFKDNEYFQDLKVNGGEISPSPAFIGGEISPGDEIIAGKLDASKPIFGSEYKGVQEPIIEVVDIPRPCLPSIFKGNKITLNIWGEEEDYLVVSIDEHGMTLKPIEEPEITCESLTAEIANKYLRDNV